MIYCFVVNEKGGFSLPALLLLCIFLSLEPCLVCLFIYETVEKKRGRQTMASNKGNQGVSERKDGRVGKYYRVGMNKKARKGCWDAGSRRAKHPKG